MAQAMCGKAPDTLQFWESKRKPATQGSIAALTGHVMITLCFHKVKEEAGSSKSLLDAVHGDGTTWQWEYLHKPPEQAVKQPCLAMELQHNVNTQELQEEVHIS